MARDTLAYAVESAVFKGIHHKLKVLGTVRKLLRVLWEVWGLLWAGGRKAGNGNFCSPLLIKRCQELQDDQSVGEVLPY